MRAMGRTGTVQPLCVCVYAHTRTCLSFKNTDSSWVSTHVGPAGSQRGVARLTPTELSIERTLFWCGSTDLGHGTVQLLGWAWVSGKEFQKLRLKEEHSERK